MQRSSFQGRYLVINYCFPQIMKNNVAKRNQLLRSFSVVLPAADARDN